MNIFLTQPKKIVKHDPVFAFKSKKSLHWVQKQRPKNSETKIHQKKEAEYLHADFHLEVLNGKKAGITHAEISIFNSTQWISRYNIKCKLSQCLDFNHNEDQLQRTVSLLLKCYQVISNIGYV